MPKYKKLDISDHCRERMRERNISEAIVHDVLSDPTSEIPAKRKGRRRFCKKVNGNLYNVVIREMNHENAIVITAY